MLHAACTTEAEHATGLFHKTLLSTDAAAPLVVLVHGRAGNADLMWAFRRAFTETCSFIAPQAYLPDPIGGWSWWQVENGQGTIEDTDQRRIKINKAKEVLQTFIERAITHYQLTPRRIVAAGFSQGAGLLSALLQRKPTQFQGVALLAGFVLEEAAPPSNTALPKVFVAHGTQDTTVPLSHCQKGVEFLQSRGFSVEFVSDPVGHKVGTSGMRQLKEWAERIVL